LSAATATQSTTRGREIRGWIPLALLILLIAVIGGYTAASSSQFLTTFNLNGLLVAIVPLSLVSMGQLVVLLVRNFDISVGGTLTLGVVVGSFVLSSDSWPKLALGMLAILGVGLLIGICNAFVIKVIGISAIITTLATFSILQGLSLQLRPVPEGPISFTFIDAMTKSWGFMPLSFIGVLAVAVACDLWLYRTKSGLTFRAVGLDEVSSRRLGKPSTQMQIAAFVVCSLFAAVGALFLAAQVGIGDPGIGIKSATLTSIAAAVVGGASFAGGRGSFLGAVAGSVFFYLIANNILPFLHLSSAYGQVLTGALTILALIVYKSPMLWAQLRGGLGGVRRTRPTAPA
jgi:ribose transport system ATP-binding protein